MLGSDVDALFGDDDLYNRGNLFLLLGRESLPRERIIGISFFICDDLLFSAIDDSDNRTNTSGIGNGIVLENVDFCNGNFTGLLGAFNVDIHAAFIE